MREVLFIAFAFLGGIEFVGCSGITLQNIETAAVDVARAEAYAEDLATTVEADPNLGHIETDVNRIVQCLQAAVASLTGGTAPPCPAPGG